MADKNRIMTSIPVATGYYDDSLYKKRSMDWSQFYKNLPTHTSGDEDDSKGSRTQRERSDVMRLKLSDMALYGLCPETDPFTAVVCNYCNAVIKPQGLLSHYINRHNFNGRDIETTNNCAISSSGEHNDLQNNKSSTNSICTTVTDMAPPNVYLHGPSSSQSTSVISAVKHLGSGVGGGSDGSGILNKIRRVNSNNSLSAGSSLLTYKKTLTGSISSTPLTNLNTTNVGNDRYTDSIMSTFNHYNHNHHSSHNNQQSNGVDVNNEISSSSFVRNTTKKRTIGNVRKSSFPALMSSNQTGSTRKCIPIKDREYSPDTHCGVLTGDPPKPCTRSLTCKSHALSLRRMVTGRTKPFDKLLNDHRQNKLINVVSSSSSTVSNGTILGNSFSSLGRNFETDSESSNSSSSMPPTVSSSSSSSSIICGPVSSTSPILETNNQIHLLNFYDEQPVSYATEGNYDMENQMAPPSHNNLPPLPPLANVWSNPTKKIEETLTIVSSIATTSSSTSPCYQQTLTSLISTSSPSMLTNKNTNELIIKTIGRNDVTPTLKPASPSSTVIDINLCDNCHGYTFPANGSSTHSQILTNCTKCRHCLSGWTALPCCHGVANLKAKHGVTSVCGLFTKVIFVVCRWCGCRFGLPGCPNNVMGSMLSRISSDHNFNQQNDENNWIVYSREFSDLRDFYKFHIFDEYQRRVKLKYDYDAEDLNHQLRAIEECRAQKNQNNEYLTPVQLFTQRFFFIKWPSSSSSSLPSLLSLRILLKLAIKSLLTDDPHGRILSLRIVTKLSPINAAIHFHAIVSGLVMADETPGEIPAQFFHACLRALQPLLVIVELRMLFGDEKNRPENLTPSQFKNFVQVFDNIRILNYDVDVENFLTTVKMQPNFREFNAEILAVKNLRTAAVLRAIYLLNIFSHAIQQKKRQLDDNGYNINNEYIQHDFNVYFLDKAVANDDPNFGLCEIDETSAGIKDKLNELLDEFFAGHDRTPTIIGGDQPMMVPPTSISPPPHDSDDKYSSNSKMEEISIFDEIKFSTGFKSLDNNTVSLFRTSTINNSKSLFFADNGNISSNSRRRDYPGIKKWYRALSKPTALNTYTMRRAGGGVIFSRKLNTFRRTITIPFVNAQQQTPLPQSSNNNSNSRMFTNSFGYGVIGGGSENLYSIAGGSYKDTLTVTSGRICGDNGSNSENYDNNMRLHKSRLNENRSNASKSVECSKSYSSKIKRINSMKKKMLRTALLSSSNSHIKSSNLTYDPSPL